MFENISKDMVVVMLDASMHQQRLLAMNVANADRHDYIPKQVSFDRLMSDLSAAKAGGLEGVTENIKASLYDVYTGNDSVNLDQHVAEMSSNVVRYKALLAALAKHGALMRIVIDAKN